MNYHTRTVVSVASPRWDNHEHTVLTADVLFEELRGMGPLPFTTFANADTDHGVEVWEKAIAGEYGPIAEYVEPEPLPEPVPHEISLKQFYMGLAEEGKITKQEALAAVVNRIIPPALQAILDGMTDEEAVYEATMHLMGSNNLLRDHPLVMVFAISEGMSEQEVDDFWRLCATF